MAMLPTTYKRRQQGKGTQPTRIMTLTTMLLLTMTLAMPMTVSAEDGTSVYILYDGRDTGSELTIAKGMG